MARFDAVPDRPRPAGSAPFREAGLVNAAVRPGEILLADDLDTLDRGEIDGLRQHNFAITIRAALATPALRERWPDLDKVTEVGDLARLPLLTRAEFAAGSPPGSQEFLLGGPGPGVVVCSSGTTGQVKVMYHSWSANENAKVLGARGVRAGALDPPRRVANCMYPGELNDAFLFVHGICRLMPALTFPLGSLLPMAEAAGYIVEHGVDTLVAGPAYGTELLTTVTGLPLRRFLYLGEAVGKERAGAIEEAMPGLEVRSLSYSTNETGPIGYQCRYAEGTTHHVHEDGVVVEVVDDHTRQPVPEGSAGEVAVTLLADSGMALFRYRVGDRGRIEPAPCRCGSMAQRLTLLGRTTTSMTVDRWTISSDQLLAALAGVGVTDPADCQLQVLWDYPTYRVRLLLSPRAGNRVTEKAVLRGLNEQQQLARILAGPRCTGFTLKRIDVAQFARTDRGKVPTLYQRGEG
jgi:phenylacetate-CoA ligase